MLQPKRKVDQFRYQGEQLHFVAGVDPELKREGIAFYQVASDLFRHGLYDDEEQKPPEMREAPRVPRRVARRP